MSPNLMPKPTADVECVSWLKVRSWHGECIHRVCSWHNASTQTHIHTNPACRQLLDPVQNTFYIHSADFPGQSGHQLFYIPKTDPMHGFPQHRVQVIVTRTQIWAVGWKRKGFPAVFCEKVDDNMRSMNSAIVVKNDDVFLEHAWSVFADFWPQDVLQKVFIRLSIHCGTLQDIVWYNNTQIIIR